MSYIISTETTCDLNLETLKKWDVRYIPMSFFVDGMEYGKPNTHQMTLKQLYDAMKAGSTTKTTMVNEYEAEQFFLELLKEGKDILHIAFASACSGTYQCLLNVANRLNETHDNKIYVLDSKCESTGEGLLVDYAVYLRKNKVKIEDNFNKCKELTNSINSLFTVDNLVYLARGGRISKSTAWLGNLINIKPLLYVDSSGKLLKGGKALGNRKALNTLIKCAIEKYNGRYHKIYVSHADRKEDAEYIISKLEAALPNVEIVIEEIGPIIGAHSGPGTLAIFVVGNNRDFEI